MKQQILNLKKKLLLIEIGGELSTEFLAIMNEHGMAEILGKLTDITEEQFREWALIGWSISFAFAKDFFFSYLEANGIYFENPVEKPIMEEYGYCEDRDAEGHLYKSYWEPQDGEEKWQESINEWWEAEEKVWSKDSCYIFEII
jgi:hypothetical protein